MPLRLQAGARCSAVVGSAHRASRGAIRGRPVGAADAAVHADPPNRVFDAAASSSLLPAAASGLALRGVVSVSAPPALPSGRSWFFFGCCSCSLPLVLGRPRCLH